MIMHSPICTKFLEAENIPVLACPACSLDMSPTEHVWDALDHCIRHNFPGTINIQISNIQKLRIAIEEEWTNIPQATINNTDQFYAKEMCCTA